MKVDPVILFLVFFTIYILLRSIIYVYSNRYRIREYRIVVEQDKVTVKRDIILMLLTHSIFFTIIYPVIVALSPLVAGDKGVSYNTFLFLSVLLLLFLVCSFVIQKKRTTKYISIVNDNFFFEKKLLPPDFYSTLEVKVIYYYLGTLGYSLSISDIEKKFFTCGRKDDILELKSDLSTIFEKLSK